MVVIIQYRAVLMICLYVSLLDIVINNFGTVSLVCVCVYVFVGQQHITYC